MLWLTGRGCERRRAWGSRRPFAPRPRFPSHWWLRCSCPTAPPRQPALASQRQLFVSHAEQHESEHAQQQHERAHVSNNMRDQTWRSVQVTTRTYETT
eukprot:504508-Rhodomonas_salina.2